MKETKVVDAWDGLIMGILVAFGGVSLFSHFRPQKVSLPITHLTSMTVATLLCIFVERCDKLDRWWFRAHFRLNDRGRLAFGDRFNPLWWEVVMLRFYVYS